MEATLAGLAARYGLGDAQVGRLVAILDELAADGEAPSSVTELAQAVNVHLADSLTALELDVVTAASSAVDIGAGAGFPGLALAVALPACEVALLESQVRKCAYIERVLVAAGIENARAVHARAEQWPQGIGAHDLAVARALAQQPVVLEYAAPLLRLGGSLVDWRGRRDHAEEDASVRAAGELGLERVAVLRVQPYEGVRNHHLHVYVKARETPGRFPRRAGVARKRPLGGAA
ncbi:MAG TPA: RsmG family class I SAM-dependent methyltransferase [Solirubrobacteraceae bacterium]|jgi:16S rRNA (guanine527-N7)-methyltransferase|nr:RsmG family class I SAM-dependent methyltransferase [Solirubrobacteraceae bacterium]